MRFKCGTLICIWTIFAHGNTTNVVTNDDFNSSGDGGVYDATSNIQKQDYNWFPLLNVTCVNRKLALRGNTACSAGMLNQNCFEGVGGSCVTSQRTISCTEKQIHTDASQYSNKTYNYNDCSGLQNVDCGSNSQHKCLVVFTGERVVCKCSRGSLGPGNVAGSDAEGDSDNPTRTIAFALSGTVMVGLLLFAVIRIRKASLHRRNDHPFERREVQGVDNEALGALPADSRLQTILNTINANGRNYELRERSDSVPGRRVYVLSPTNSDPGPRGRGFSRTTSQLSSIAEESVEDAMSHITEATEPVEDDNVFKYDSDAINAVDKNHSTDCAFDDDVSTKPASSTEAIDCINDVIAMYDVEHDANDDVDEVMKENGVIPSSDFRKSLELGGEDFLKNFGWKPQERAWKIEKLKDESSKSNERLYASCSTLNSRYSEQSGESSCASLRNSDDVDVDDVSATTPLISNGDMMPSNLKPCQSLPSILDTSQIPDIEEILSKDNGDCDIIDIEVSGEIV